MRMCHAGGFTLIEVLVAVLILAIGIAGAAASQLAALRTRHGSSLTTQALELAGALADRMRANAAYLRAGDDNPYASLDYDSVHDGAPPAALAACYGGAGCGPAQIAQFDVDEVRAAIHQGFPGGRILVCRDGAVWQAAQGLSWDCSASPGAPLVIKIGWRGKRADGASDTDGAGVFAPAVAMPVEVMP